MWFRGIKMSLFWAVVLFFMACQKVIDIPLNDADQLLVVEAVLKDSPGNNYVILSRSGSVYEDTGFEKIAEATVKVTDDLGTVYDFDYLGEGVFSKADFQTLPNRTYYLEVNALGQTITASSHTLSKPKIDSLTYFNLAGYFGVPADDTLYLVSFHSVENGAERNQYLLKIFRNGVVNSGYYLGNDDFINGQYYEAQFFGSEADPGDTVLVEMVSMDEANYRYYVGLANNLNTGPFSVAPANPPSNLNGGALGFFGAYTTDTIRIILP